MRTHSAGPGESGEENEDDGHQQEAAGQAEDESERAVERADTAVQHLSEMRKVMRLTIISVTMKTAAAKAICAMLDCRYRSQNLIARVKYSAATAAMAQEKIERTSRVNPRTIARKPEMSMMTIKMISSQRLAKRASGRRFQTITIPG